MLRLQFNGFFCFFRSADGLVVVHFYADWASECQPMNDVLQILADDNELKVASDSHF